MKSEHSYIGRQTNVGIIVRHHHYHVTSCDLVHYYAVRHKKVFQIRTRNDKPEYVAFVRQQQAGHKMFVRQQ